MSTEPELIRQQSSRFLPATVIAETGSTNRDLMERASVGAPEGLVLVADHQTNGRGRQGRTWFDEPQSALLVSWLLRPSGYEIGLIPLITGMAVVDAVNDLGAQAALKWPNDVLVPAHGERKLAGILAEAATSSGPEAGGPSLHVVVGLGLNLSFTHAPAAGERAIDLASLLDPVPTKLDLLEQILCRVDSYVTQLEKGHDEDVRAAYIERCGTVGRTVRFETPDGDIAGEGVGIDATGALLIRTETALVAVSAGDAHHL